MTTRGGLGLLGGTFDPPHVGHLVAAAQCLEQLELASVLLLVAGDPWQKSERGSVTPAFHRVAMTRLAFEGVPGMVVDDREVHRSGPTYTIETVQELVDSLGEPPVLILGGDAAAGLGSWHRTEDLMGMVELAVVDRPGAQIGSLEDLVGNRAIHHVRMPPIDISSEDLRVRLARGGRVDGMISAQVIAYIGSHALYREPQ